MAPITEVMIRKRAEHNDGVLETLEELVLQDESIEKIETIGRLCPNIKILYMPNNLIHRIENLHRLKSLEYLNLAINNILEVGGLEGCEALNKLDLTLNFIDNKGLLTISKLCINIHLRELFLTGNPCTDYSGYRNFVIAKIPNLKYLDGFKIKPSERIISQQKVYRLERELLEKCVIDSKYESLEEPQELPQVNEKGELIREYTITNRVLEHKEMEQARKDKKCGTSFTKEQRSNRRIGFDPLPIEGRIFQKNEGRWDFKFTESDCGGIVLCDVAVGRYLDTSLIDVDAHPTLLRILIKGKLLQLKLPCEVKPDVCSVQRSTITGRLLVSLPKVVPNSHPFYMTDTTHVIPHIQSRTNIRKISSSLSKKYSTNGEKDIVNIHKIVDPMDAIEQVNYGVLNSQTHLIATSPTFNNQHERTNNTNVFDDDMPLLE